ncbi:MAG: response regulator [Deltaproteobacteria bacterium]|nr:response regulator [Deltaproteobacteria bacterium]
MKKIILADDEKRFSELLRSELESGGYAVDLVHDGVEAVLKVLDNKYDIALLDIMMPNLDGINTTRILKKINSPMPVIVFSGVAGSGEMAQSVRAGALRCLTKPFTVQQLLTEIKTVLKE